ncbi:MAG: sterol desaturase family protein [Candidatus Obscuribacterales bacterium]|nr:sterol desaturase family protein [Candidatus Obscuribacterales bacterium]
MFILQIVGWFIFSCVLMSFIEHQVHSRLMHRKNFLSERSPSFKRTFEAHAIFHHGHYSKMFTDEPVAVGEDKEIRLTVRKAPIKALPVAALIASISWQGALILVAVVTLHHWIWNKIHLEMHKPEGRGFNNWPIYKFLARYHWLHHKYPDKNFNVVFPLADYVLGTNARANDIDRKCMHEQFGTRLKGSGKPLNEGRNIAKTGVNHIG